MKKRIFKKLLPSLTVLLLLAAIVPEVPAFALESSGCAAQILSTETPSEIFTYANSVLPLHLHAAGMTPAEYGLNDEEISHLVLGTPFRIYELENGSFVSVHNYYFPVLSNTAIVAILAVAQTDDGNLSSTFSKGFSESLDNVLKTNHGEEFRLVDIDDEIWAVDPSDALLLADNSDDSSAEETVSQKTIEQVNDISKDTGKDGQTEESTVDVTQASAQLTSGSLLRGVVGPTDSQYINVPVVGQNSYAWCWAATCASIINYTKNRTLIASAVVRYTFHGQMPTSASGTTEQDMDAYRHWGLNPVYDPQNAIWSSVVRELKSGKPIHSLWYPIGSHEGHSMVVRGFEYYADRDGAKVYLLMDPNYGYTSVTGQESSGDCCYIVGGTRYYWTESLRNLG